jgi:HTH-type transcriptional regulator, transcriptional repressor of NAD biosynthesis genes
MNTSSFSHGLVIGKFYPPHAGHVYLIRTAAAHCSRVTVGVLASSVESIPMEQRLAWLRATFVDCPHVRIVAQLDDVPVDYHSPTIWAAHVALMRLAIVNADAQYGAAPAVDVVFTSEPYGDELARQFSAAHVCLDQTRHLYPVSGTAVRANPVACWDGLPPEVRAGIALRVVVVGAESTGTTTLSRDLTAALRARAGVWGRTAWVAEYGREYSANALALLRAHQPAAAPQDIAWSSQDFVHIAQTQCEREHSAALHTSPVLVCDTDALATCVWHERYMGQGSDAVAEIAACMPARALYLLTSDVGVPFEDDGLRDGEHLRAGMTQRFRDVLCAQSVPWLEVQGPPASRCQNALHAVDEALHTAWQWANPLG